MPNPCQCGCGGFTAKEKSRYIHGHNKKGIDAEKRFWDKVGPVTEAGCWPWLGCKQSNGYGYFWNKNHSNRAHRFSFNHFRGPIPKGFVLDHICRNRDCVNPFHLEVVTSRTNILRGVGISAENHKKTHCSNGHEYTSENTFMRRGRRICRECEKIRGYKYRGTRMFSPDYIAPEAEQEKAVSQ